MPCELCGNPVAPTRRFLVEKTPLNVCTDCERFGKSLEPTPGRKAAPTPGNVPQAMERRQKRHGERDVYASDSMQMELVADYADRIRRARETKGWTRQDLGGRVGEREVSMGRIEAGQLRPVDEVARKLERELGIQLFESVRSVSMTKSPVRGLTLGDVLKGALRKGDEDEDDG